MSKHVDRIHSLIFFISLVLLLDLFSVEKALGRFTDDGLEFSINRIDDFVRRKFSVAGVELTDTWGFVDENDVPIDHTGYAEVHQSNKDMNNRLLDVSRSHHLSAIEMNTFYFTYGLTLFYVS